LSLLRRRISPLFISDFCLYTENCCQLKAPKTGVISSEFVLFILFVTCYYKWLVENVTKNAVLLSRCPSASSLFSKTLVICNQGDLFG
jgi:hypothetical protein